MTNIEKLRDLLARDADIEAFVKVYSERYQLNDAFLTLVKKCSRYCTQILRFYLLVLYAALYEVPQRDVVLFYLGEYGNVDLEKCCCVINAVRKRVKENAGFGESTAAALVDNLQREGRKIQYGYRYGENMLDPAAADYYAVPYRCYTDWQDITSINVAMVADGFVFPRKMDLTKEGSEGTWKLKGILSPTGEIVSFSCFLELFEAREITDEWETSRIWAISWLKAHGIMDVDETLIFAMAETGKLEKFNPDSLSHIRKNPVWRADRYVMKAGIIAAAMLGAFEDDEETRSKSLAFLDSITDSFPTEIYLHPYDEDRESKKILQEYVNAGYLKFVPAGSLDSGNIYIPRFGSRESREKLLDAPWLQRRLPLTEDRKIWLEKLELPQEVASKEIDEVEDADSRKIAMEILRALYMPKDKREHYEVNREAFRGKEGSRKLDELKQILWSRGDLSSDLMNPSELHAVFDALEPVYEPDYAKFFMHHYQEISTDRNIRNMMPQIQKAWGSIQYYRSLNARKFKDLPAWKLSFNDIFRIMAEGTYDRREFEDSRYDEAELFSARYGFQQKGFEQACRLQNEMLKRKKTSIPDIGGQIGAFSYRMLALDDIAGAFFGQMLDCCQMIGGAGASCMYHSCTSENGRVFLITDKSNRPVAGSWVWRNGSTICFDNIEGVRPSAEKAITLVYKEAAEKLAQAAANLERSSGEA